MKVNKKQATGDDAIMTHYEIVVDDDTLCFIYEPYGCYSYNTIKVNNKTVKVATIETMLLFLLAFMYADRPYYDHERIICMAEYLINVQAKNRLEQKGLLKRFNVNCYGKEKTLVEIRGETASKYKELKNAQDSKEYNKYFFKYIPNKANKANKANKGNMEKNDSFQSDDSSSEDKYSDKKYEGHKNKSHKNKKYATRRRPFNNNKRTRKNNVVRKMFGNIF